MRYNAGMNNLILSHISKIFESLIGAGKGGAWRALCRLRPFLVLWGVFVSLSVLCITPGLALAQPDTLFHGRATTPSADGEVLSQPLCSRIVNKAPYTVIGSVRTNSFVREDGVRARHQSNFRLKPDEINEFCTSGPFYDGRKIELTLRTLIPVFSCKSRLDGDIVIHGRFLDEGGTRTWAICYE